MPERFKFGVTCKYCGSRDTWIEWREVIDIKPLTSFSLSGAQTKVTAEFSSVPHAVCDGCGHVSVGEKSSS